MSRPTASIGHLEFDGQAIPVHENDSIAASLVRAGILVTRHSTSGQPRGVYCGIGICNDCLVAVDGTPNVRACVTPARRDSKVLNGTRDR